MGAQPQLITHDFDDKEIVEIRVKQPENLGTLYQGVLTGITRLQSGRQHITDADSFRRRTKAALTDIERVAVNEGYDPEYVRDSHFAVVAFLDEVVLYSSSPVRSDWERRLLQEELFGRTDAGEAFFEKLARLEGKRNTPHLVNTLEVFLICLLLGFEGRYAGPQSNTVDSIVARLTRRVHEVRGSTPQLSPHGIPQEPIGTEAPAVPSKSRNFHQVFFGSIAVMIVLYLLYYWNLAYLSDQAISVLGAKG